MKHRRVNQSLMAVSLLGVATPAFAYLDPSTGSMILSAVVGMLATAMLAIKTYWYKLKNFFRRDRGGVSGPDSQKKTPAPADSD